MGRTENLHNGSARTQNDVKGEKMRTMGAFSARKSGHSGLKAGL